MFLSTTPTAHRASTGTEAIAPGELQLSYEGQSAVIRPSGQRRVQRWVRFFELWMVFIS